MEKLKGLKIRYRAVLDAVSFLEEALTLLSETNINDRSYKHIRNSVIQSFEFSVECFWKFLKEYLFLIHGISIDVATPKMTIKEAYRLDLVSEKERLVLFEMIDTRNLTSHTYNENLAERMSKKIPQFYDNLCVIMKRIDLL